MCMHDGVCVSSANDDWSRGPHGKRLTIISWTESILMQFAWLPASFFLSPEPVATSSVIRLLLMALGSEHAFQKAVLELRRWGRKADRRTRRQTNTRTMLGVSAPSKTLAMLDVDRKESMTWKEFSTSKCHVNIHSLLLSTLQWPYTSVCS